MSDPIETLSPVSEHMMSRRGFLAAAGVAGAGLALFSGAGITLAAPSASQDLQIAQLAASLEVLAVNTYQAALAAAGAGKLGTVPPAVATYVQTALAEHQYQLGTWNQVITGAGKPAVDTPPADLNATVNQMFGQVKDVTGAANLAQTLEQIAADTYFTAVPNLESGAAIEMAGNYQIVDQQHRAILLFVLGQYPVPDTFQKGDKAYAPTGSVAGATTPAPVPAPVQAPM